MLSSMRFEKGGERVGGGVRYMGLLLLVWWCIRHIISCPS